MKNSITYWAVCLMALSALQGCSEKTVTPPAAVPAPAATPAPAKAAQAAAPAAPAPKSATLQCEDRKIALEASCRVVDELETVCSSQRLTVSDSGTGKTLNVREFTPGKATNEHPALVAEQFSDISCVRTKSNEKFIVAMMGNGGNCEECEWADVYSWDGVLLGSEGGKRKKVKGLAGAVEAANDEQVPAIGKTQLPGFYSADPE